MLGVGKRPFGPGNHRDSSILDGLFGGDFVAHQADVVRRRADEDEFVFLDHGREVGVFGQEPVTWVDGVHMGDGGGTQDRRHVQIAVLGRRRPDADGLVGQAHVHGVIVGGGMNGDGADAHFPARSLDAERDFAAVGDQDFVKHR